jgi:predicted ABC-type ATPase
VKLLSIEKHQKYWKELSEINQSAGNGVAIGPPSGSDDDPSEDYENGGKIVFNANHIPNKWILNYAVNIKKDHPEIWKLGGNIFGNEAFINLKRVADRGYWLDSEQWMYKKWRSYVARHTHDFRIEGVVAMLKWVDKVEKGWQYMKNLIEEKIKKIEDKKSPKMSSGGKINIGDTWEWHGIEYDAKKGDNYKVVKEVVITSVDSKGQVKGKFVGTTNDFIVREPEKYLKKKVSSSSKMSEGGGLNNDNITADKIIGIVNKNGKENKPTIVEFKGKTYNITRVKGFNLKTILFETEKGDKLFKHKDILNIKLDPNSESGPIKKMVKGGYITYKDKYNTKYKYKKGESHSLEEVSKDTGVSMKGLQQIYNKGIGAYKTNPSSVRPTVTSKEQWAMARVYSAVMGGDAAIVDKSELKMETGGKIELVLNEIENNGNQRVRLSKYSSSRKIGENYQIITYPKSGEDGNLSYNMRVTEYTDYNKFKNAVKRHLKMEKGGLIAPNGKTSNLTAQQYKLVRTPAFKAWFGDWENDPANASKVVDENGEPLVVYRGDSSASKKGNIFKTGFNRMSFINRNRLPNQYFHYFINNYDVALGYAKNQIEDHNDKVEETGKGKLWNAEVTPYFLNIRNYIDLTPSNPAFPTFEEFKDAYKKQLGEEWYNREEYRMSYDYGFQISRYQLNKILEKELGKDYLENQERWTPISSWTIENFQVDKQLYDTYSYFIEYKGDYSASDILSRIYYKMLEKNIDGLLLLESTHWDGGFWGNWKKYMLGELTYDYKKWTEKPKVFAALESNQIKLADGTNTTFDSNNPDIRFNHGGELDSKREYLEKRLWNERGYEYPYLNKLSLKELRSLYDTEFYYDEEFKEGGDVSEYDDYEKFKKQQLKKGTQHELEHRDTIEKFKRKGISDVEVAKEIAQDHLDENLDYYIQLAEMENNRFDDGGEVKENNYRISISENDKYIGEYPNEIATIADAKSIFIQLESKYRRPQYLISVYKRPTSSSGWQKINIDEWYSYVENFEVGGRLKRQVLDSEYYENGGGIDYDSIQPKDKNGVPKIDDKSLEILTERILKLPQTKSFHTDKDGNYTKERKELHKEIINKFKKEAVCITKGRPIAILMGGSPASGKSSFIKKYRPYLMANDIVKVDADEIRAKLPEYKGFNATQTHLETKDIVNTLISDRNIGVPCNFDLIYDGTMNSVKSYEPLIELLRKNNYKIFIIYIDRVPYETVVSRMKERYKKSGRFVPVEVIDDFFSKGTEALNKLKKQVDGYVVVDGSNFDYDIIERGGEELPQERNHKFLGKLIDQKKLETIEYKGGGKITGGDCYQAAGNFVINQRMMPDNIKFVGEPYIVHAQVTGQGSIDGLKYGHAWVEDDQLIYDYSNGRELVIPKEFYYALGKIKTIKPRYFKYTFEQARKKMLDSGHYGPWDLKTESGL